MVHVVAGPERAKLGFTNAVGSAFKFLEDDLGFHVARVEEPTLVRYESRTTFVNVYHSRGGYRVGVDMGRFIRHAGEVVEDRVNLYEVVSAVQDHVAARSLDVPAESAATVHDAVHGTARLVQKYGTGFLRGDSESYSEVGEHRRLTNARLAAEGARRWEMRQAAHRAWARGDRQEAVQLLRQLPGLTDDEKQMLSISADNS